VATKDPISDDFWEAIQPLLPPGPPADRGGSPRIPHRAVLSGILFILRHARGGNRSARLPLSVISPPGRPAGGRREEGASPLRYAATEWSSSEGGRLAALQLDHCQDLFLSRDLSGDHVVDSS
jgi:hypothetical protein